MRRKKISTTLTGQQVMHLLRGWALSVNTEYGHDRLGYPFRDDAHRKQLWLENREYLLSLEGVLRIPGVFGGGLKKGERPAAMHAYEKPKRRPKV